MSRRRVPGWPGYIHRQKNGLDLFIIERKIRGRRYHVSTGAHTITAAKAQLERFESDPAGYRPDGAGDRLQLTAQLVIDWTTFQHAKGNTGKYVRDHARKMATWAERLAGADLRKLTLKQLRDGLAGLSAQKHRIIAIKAFFSWLRTEKGLVTTAQDATLDLKVPQSDPAKWKKRKAVPWQHVEKLLAHMQAAVEAETGRELAATDKVHPGEDARRRRDVLLLLTATAWHVTELRRFIRSGEIVRQASGEVLAVLVTMHKGKEPTRMPVVHREHLEAADRLRMYGKIPRWLERTHYEFCDAAGVPRFGLGVMRHSVATWAVEAKEHPERVAAFLQHKDPRTTKRFYIDVAVPTNVIPLRRVKS